MTPPWADGTLPCISARWPHDLAQVNSSDSGLDLFRDMLTR